jgi:hypothetical protein
MKKIRQIPTRFARIKQLCKQDYNPTLTPFAPSRCPIEDEIRLLCGRLIVSDDPAEIRVLGQQLRWILHQWLQEARSQIRVLPLLNTKANRKKAA